MAPGSALRETGNVRTHLIWDWNGTLLRDDRAVLAATNEALVRLHFPDMETDGTVPLEIAPGVSALTAERYQALFTRPLTKFYSAVFSRDVSEAEFAKLEVLFRAAYRRRLDLARLDDGAVAALDGWRAAGRSQSLLSLWGHDELIQRTAYLGLDSYFVRIDGRQASEVKGLDGKAEPLRRHLEQLRTAGSEQVSRAIASGRVAMIGDTLDDAAAAQAAGIACVLFAGGSHSVDQLTATGAPVASTLAAAIRAVERLVIDDESDGTFL
jgi:phosphoglycolate phosphatase-like HAD superfamily hydrolase